jgi:D-glycero-D-manno-heptose 1,7-bisphosphate phosphatase
VRAAVFLDRDGVLIEEVSFLSSLHHLALFPWATDAIRALNRAGLPVVVITNQSGIARGFFTEAFVDEVHHEIAARLSAGGARIDAYYYCPHHPDGRVTEYARSCDCRKPERGLIDRAARDLNLDPARSFVVGDKWSDIELARAAGAGGVLVRTGRGAAEQSRHGVGITADAIVDNLAAAASWILENLRSGDRVRGDRRSPI